MNHYASSLGLIDALISNGKSALERLTQLRANYLEERNLSLVATAEEPTQLLTRIHQVAHIVQGFEDEKFIDTKEVHRRLIRIKGHEKTEPKDVSVCLSKLRHTRMVVGAFNDVTLKEGRKVTAISRKLLVKKYGEPGTKGKTETYADKVQSLFLTLGSVYGEKDTSCVRDRHSVKAEPFPLKFATMRTEETDPRLLTMEASQVKMLDDLARNSRSAKGILNRGGLRRLALHAFKVGDIEGTITVNNLHGWLSTFARGYVPEIRKGQSFEQRETAQLQGLRNALQDLCDAGSLVRHRPVGSRAHYTLPVAVNLEEAAPVTPTEGGGFDSKAQPPELR